MRIYSGMHARIQDFISGGWGSRPDGQKTVWTSFFNPQLILQFTEGIQWFYNRENYTFEGSKGGPTFSRGGGGGPTFSTGVHMLISIETHITCDFPGGGGPDPLSPPQDLHLLLGLFGYMQN